jgi:hypothetical protein
MATTTTATRLTLRPTTTTSQSTTPQLGPTTELFTTLPVPTPLPLPTTHTITAQPHPSTPAILRSTSQTTRPSQRPTKHTHLHRPLTTIPSPTLPLTPFSTPTPAAPTTTATCRLRATTTPVVRPVRYAGSSSAPIAQPALRRHVPLRRRGP